MCSAKRDSEKWKCHTCTFFNEPSHHRCWYHLFLSSCPLSIFISIFCFFFYVHSSESYPTFSICGAQRDHFNGRQPTSRHIFDNEQTNSKTGAELVRANAGRDSTLKSLVKFDDGIKSAMNDLEDTDFDDPSLFEDMI